MIFNVLSLNPQKISKWLKPIVFKAQQAEPKAALAEPSRVCACRGGRSKSMQRLQHTQDWLIRNISTNATKPLP